MAKSVVNEEVPDEMQVTFGVDANGIVRKVKGQQMAGGPLVGWPDGVGAKVVTAWTSATFPDRITLEPAPDPALITSLRKTQVAFAYLDCGRWGGPMKVGGPQQRCFGLIWGPWAALCEFAPNDSFANDGHLIPDKGNLLNEVLLQLRGSGGASVQLIKYVYSPAPNPDSRNWKTDWATVYLVLPDFHLPISVRTPGTAGSDGPAMGRYGYRDAYMVPNPRGPSSLSHFTVVPGPDGMVTNPLNQQVEMGQSGQTWFERYREGDIFGLPGGSADRDLRNFLDRLARAPVRDKVHLVHVGDMYDLWIGLDAFFDQAPTSRVRIGDRQGIKAAEFIDYWCWETNRLFGGDYVDRATQAMVKGSGTLAALANLPVREKSWLWGNHDNYLAPPEEGEGGHTPGWVPRRRRQIRQNGVFIEHGQRRDPSNRDGELDGHTKTNQVFASPPLRAFDPTRRGFFTTDSAAQFLMKPDFGVYAMGHTHMPFLTKVVISVETAPPPPGPRPKL